MIDRKKMLIKYKAHQVPPSLLEDFVRKHFTVQDIVVVGVPGEDDVGHLPAAVVVLPPNSTVTETKITKAIEGIPNPKYILSKDVFTGTLFCCIENFSDDKHLRGGVYFINTIPRTENGKIQRSLVQQFAVEQYLIRRLNKVTV